MADPSENVPPLKLFTDIGVPGLRRSGGYVLEEFARELKGQGALRVFKEMGENDPIVGGLLTLIGGLFRTIDWTVEPLDPQVPEDVLAAEFIAEEVDLLEPSVPELMSETVDMFQYGFALAEVVYRRRDDGKIGWREWRFLSPESRDRWIFDDDTDEALAFVQRNQTTFEELIIPLEKCLHFRTTRRKGNPEGKSILRNSWRSWFYKTKLEEIEAIGCERDLAGLPVMRIPVRHMDPNAAPADKALYDLAKVLVRNIRRDEHEGVVIPSDVWAGTNEPMISFELMSASGTRAIDIGRVIERHDSRIAMAALADFLLLGHQQVGTFSLSSDKTSMFSVVFGGFADVLSSELTRQAGNRLLKLNNMKGRVLFRHSDFEKEDVSAFASSIKQLTDAGVLIGGEPNLEGHVRELFNLPPADEEFMAEYKAQEEEQKNLEREALTATLKEPDAVSRTDSQDKGGVSNDKRPAKAGG